MARLGLFFTFMTDCWYPSRKPKCKSHLWLHRCSPSRPSPPVQMCSLWQQPWLRTVGAGGSVLARSCTSVLVSAPLFCLWGSTSASRCAGDRCWCLGLRSTLLPTLRMNHLSLMTFLAGVGQFLVFFFFLPLSRQEIFQYCAWWFHVTNPLSWLLILLAIFLTTLYWL